jgi:hypothetical protein
VTRLQTDNEFRKQLTEDPRGVLWEYGVDYPAELLPEKVTLPSKTEVRKLLTELRRTGEFRGRPGPQHFFPIFTCFFVFPLVRGTPRR